MTVPTPKTIGDITVTVDERGWPFWTRINIPSGLNGVTYGISLNEEQAHDLHYALSRIVEYLDDRKKIDRMEGRVA